MMKKKSNNSNFTFNLDFDMFTSSINEEVDNELLKQGADLLDLTYPGSTNLSFSRALFKLMANNVISREDWKTKESEFSGNLNRYVFIDELENGTKLVKEVIREGYNEKTMNYYPSTSDIIANDWFVAYKNTKSDESVKPKEDLTFDIKTSIDYLKKGKAVRRTSWTGKKYRDFLIANNVFGCYVIYLNGIISGITYSFTISDVLATDWTLYTE